MMLKKTEKPWGYEELLLDKDGLGFKRLVVNPGKMTSKHYHNHKNEVFYVEQGSARVELKNDTKELKKGEFMYLPRETIHQTFSTGTEELVILEFGSPQDDTDVVRVEDPWKGKRNQ